MAESGIVISIFIIICSTICISLAIYTYYRLKLSKMDLIKEGILKPEKRGDKPQILMGWGLFFVAVGAAVLIGSCWAGEVGVVYKIGGLVPLFIGVAMAVYYIGLRKKWF